MEPTVIFHLFLDGPRFCVIALSFFGLVTNFNPSGRDVSKTWTVTDFNKMTFAPRLSLSLRTCCSSEARLDRGYL